MSSRTDAHEGSQGSSPMPRDWPLPKGAAAESGPDQLAAGIANLTQDTRIVCGQWYTKPWGRFKRLYADLNVQIERIEVVAGGYCTRHLHRRKHNLFSVIRGLLLVETWLSDAQMPRLLRPGECLLIPAGVQHRFRALQETVAHEIYEPADTWTVDPQDIVRFADDGRLPPAGSSTPQGGVRECSSNSP